MAKSKSKSKKKKYFDIENKHEEDKGDDGKQLRCVVSGGCLMLFWLMDDEKNLYDDGEEERDGRKTLKGYKAVIARAAAAAAAAGARARAEARAGGVGAAAAVLVVER
uniref:Uncharacterized protein n=1 Tax=Syphacia muris TaxID=451379 RepID=A0A0N5AGP8_9BILA